MNPKELREVMVVANRSYHEGNKAGQAKAYRDVVERIQEKIERLGFGPNTGPLQDLMSELVDVAEGLEGGR